MATVASRTATAVTSSVSPTSTVRVTPQGGVLEGSDPTQYDASNPITLFIIQVRGLRVLYNVPQLCISK